jgi:hypothetical protein
VRLVVTGGRDYDDRDPLESVLDGIHERLTVDVLIEGEARGADTLAREWAESRGITVEPYPAKWQEYGRKAGPIRNRQMIDEGRPDYAAVFYDRPRDKSRGTANMHTQLDAFGIKILAVIDAPD